MQKLQTANKNPQTTKNNKSTAVSSSSQGLHIESFSGCQSVRDGFWLSQINANTNQTP